MTHDLLDVVLRLAYAEGAIELHGAYERAVEHRGRAQVSSREGRERMLRHLEKALSTGPGCAAIPMTVGMYLQSTSKDGTFNAVEIAQRLHLTRNMYRMMERDRISPLEVPGDAWRRFRDLFKLSTESLEEMLLRTHGLVFFQHSFRSTLARYPSGSSRKARAEVLHQAAVELYARADLPLPPVEKERLCRLFALIETGTSS